MSTIVPAAGKSPNDVLLVGEAPGREEAAKGKPFVGKAGREQEAYLARYGLSTHTWRRTNVVQEFTPGNPDPTPHQIREGTATLQAEVDTCCPRVIVAVGRFAARWFLGESADLETVHGLPHLAGAFDSDRQDRARGAIVVPIYHPALGFYDGDARAYINWDYQQVAGIVQRAVRGEVVTPIVDTWAGRETYMDVGGRELADTLNRLSPPEVAIDTEGVPSNPWSIQVSWNPGIAATLRLSRDDFQVGIYALQQLADSGTTFVMHNAMYDIEMSRVVGLDLSQATLFDTMYAAYLLRLEPQGLKALAWRWAGMKMEEYREVVGDVGVDKQTEYLVDVLDCTWPRPEERVIRENDGTYRIYKPQPVAKRVEKILSDYYGGKVDKDGNLPDLYKRWYAVDDELREQVEGVLGKLPIGTLADIELDNAVYYSSRDADATIRLYHRLLPVLKERDLERTMRDGMHVLPVFEEMQATGIVASRSKFEELQEYLEFEMVKLQSRISYRYYQGKPFNPASSKQVGALLRRRGLQGTKRTSTGAVSTGKKSIEHLRYVDEAVAAVLDWREHQKIRDAFCKPALARAPKNGDELYPVRCQIKTTRVHTRRLAMADPNLMQIPARTELGRRVRECYVAPPGQVYGAWDLCLAPETKVLTADLDWVPIQSVRKGDRLVAIDEDCRVVETKTGRRLGRPRRLQTADVEKVGRRQAKCIRIHLSNGRSVVATLEHPWLARNRYKNGKHDPRWGWRKTEDLQVGDELCRLVDPWEPESSWEAGWLAGMFDGEGNLNKNGGTITLSQRAGNVLDLAKNLLAERGYDFYNPVIKRGGFPGSNETEQLWMCGMIDILHLLGTLRPQRLLEGVERVWEGKELRRHHKGKNSPNSCDPSVTVTGIEDVGVQDVVSMQTSTRTFVAEGVFTHNSQIEVRVAAHISQDELLCRLLREGKDIHTETAARIFGVKPEDVDPMEHRYPAKRGTFGVLYGVQGEGLLTQLRMMGTTGWTVDRCEELIREWLRVYKGVAKAIEDTKKEVRQRGYIRDLWGMYRYLPGVWSHEGGVRAEAERQAFNHKVQGGAQGMCQNSAAYLRPLIRELQEAGLEVWWCLQIHDELVLRFDEELWDVLDPVVVDALVSHAGIELSVPVEASGHMATTFGGLK